MGGGKMLIHSYRLINLAIPPPGVRFKQSAMPFVQMENISQFLHACQQPPLNLQQHDMFLTVDLFESKDPAQVLQCLGAFGRAAHNVNPTAFPTAIGNRASRGGVLSPQNTGTGTSPRGRGMSNASNGSSAYSSRTALAASKTGDSNSGRWSPTKSPTKSPTSISSWSKKELENSTAPAWNIAQYGYMGGASQGNLGISFGGRRQITSASPHVPSLAEKERLRKEKEAEEERQRQQMEEERRRKAELEAEEERARQEEQRRREEARRLRTEEKRKVEEERRRWEEEERQWRLTEERRRKEEEEAEARLAEERKRSKSKGDGRLRGQMLSQYQAEETTGDDQGYSSRVVELEKELELARQREQEYERERQGRQGRPDRPLKTDDSKSRTRSRSRPARPPSRQDSWSRDEREVLRTQWNQQSGPQSAAAQQHQQQQQQQAFRPPRPLPDPRAPALPPRVSSNKTGEKAPTHEVQTQRTAESPPKVKSHRTGDSPKKLQKQRTGESPTKVKSHNTGGRPLPDPTAYSSTPPPGPPPSQSRTDRYLASNPVPQQHFAQQTYSRELGATEERDAEDRRRAQTQQRTKAGGLAGKSLLEREMEMERQRQREWEEAQKETVRAPRDPEAVTGVGGRWDVGQWGGYTGGDNQNRGAQGIGVGRRQIVGPRPLPGGSR